MIYKTISLLIFGSSVVVADRSKIKYFIVFGTSNFKFVLKSSQVSDICLQNLEKISYLNHENTFPLTSMVSHD